MSTQRKCVDVCVRERASNVREAERVLRERQKHCMREPEKVCVSENKRESEGER